MNKMIPVLLTAGLLSLGQAASALPQMDITAAKGTLTTRQKTPTAAAFLKARVRDQPSFDKLGIGNYYAEYRLNSQQQLQVWMYVESAPPLVDEVVVYIYPAKPADVSFQRAQKLLNIVYGESSTGNKVVADFTEAFNLPTMNQYKKPTAVYGPNRSLLPTSYDGGLYYLGKNFGYKVGYHKGGLEVGIYRKDYWQKFIMGVKALRFHDPLPPPKPGPTPLPPPKPLPTIVW